MSETETVIALTDDQKIAILEGAKEILGPNGENWTKSCWWGIKLSNEEIDEALRENGYDPETLDDDDLKEINVDNDYDFERRAVGPTMAEQANVWCLMGALEESAYRLGITQQRDSSERLAEPVSLKALVENSEQWQGWSVIDVNDNPDTQFEDVRGLIDERLAQLRAQ